MPCSHIQKVKELFRIRVNWFVERCDTDYVRGEFERCGWEEIIRRFSGNYCDWMWFAEIYFAAKECNCEGEDTIRYLRNRVSELEGRVSSAESSSSNQLVLRRNVEADLSVVRRERDSLDRRVSDLQSNNWSLQREKDNLNELIRDGKRVLQTTQSQLTTVQNQLTRKNNDYDDLNRRFNALQLEKREKEIEITSLREELEGSQNIDLRYKKKKLDELTRDLGLDWQRVRDLCEAYERLKRASDRENYNQDNITAAQTDINNIEREFFQTNINVDDLHKVYKVCEKVAELRVKQEKIRQQQQQQYQALQEQPTI